MTEEWDWPTHCIDCGAPLMGGATVQHGRELREAPPESVRDALAAAVDWELAHKEEFKG